MSQEKAMGRLELRYKQLRESMSYAEVRERTVLYCEAMDQYFDTYCPRFQGGEFFDDRKYKAGGMPK